MSSARLPQLQCWDRRLVPSVARATRHRAWAHSDSGRGCICITTCHLYPLLTHSHTMLPGPDADADADAARSIDLAAAAEGGNGSTQRQLQQDLNLLMEEITGPKSPWMIPMILVPEAGTSCMVTADFCIPAILRTFDACNTCRSCRFMLQAVSCRSHLLVLLQCLSFDVSPPGSQTSG